MVLFVLIRRDLRGETKPDRSPRFGAASRPLKGLGRVEDVRAERPRRWWRRCPSAPVSSPAASTPFSTSTTSPVHSATSAATSPAPLSTTDSSVTVTASSASVPESSAPPSTSASVDVTYRVEADTPYVEIAYAPGEWQQYTLNLSQLYGRYALSLRATARNIDDLFVAIRGSSEQYCLIRVSAVVVVTNSGADQAECRASAPDAATGRRSSPARRPCWPTQPKCRRMCWYDGASTPFVALAVSHRRCGGDPCRDVVVGSTLDKPRAPKPAESESCRQSVRLRPQQVAEDRDHRGEDLDLGGGADAFGDPGSDDVQSA